MDLMKSTKRRSRISEFAYVSMNIGLAVVLLLIVLAVESPYLAFALVLISKWRIFAVRPRYWFANFLANLVDIIVSVSVVVLLYSAAGAIAAQIAFTLLYIVWLLFIKPRSKRSYVIAQSSVAVFLGVTALYTVSFGWNELFVVAIMWLIGYSSARHVLTAHDESRTPFLSLAWGGFIAELGWLFYHWTYAYALPGFGNVKLVQAAVVVLLVSFVAERSYTSWLRHKQIRAADVLMPMILMVSIVLLLVLLFNRIGVTDGRTF